MNCEPLFVSDLKNHYSCLYNNGIVNICNTFDSVVAGGYWRSYYDEISPKDIDIFAPDEKTAMEVVLALIELKVWDLTWSNKEKDIHALTLKEEIPISYLMGIRKINVIGVPEYFQDSKVENLLNRFDFTCCCFCSSIGFGFIYSKESSIKDSKNKLLKLNNPNSPARSLERAFMFATRGYKITRATTIGLVKGCIDTGFDKKDFYNLGRKC